MLMARLCPTVAVFAVAGGVLTGCGADDDGITRYDDPSARRREVAWSQSGIEVDARFVSVAIDTAQIVGAPWWDPAGEVETAGGTRPYPALQFDRPRLATLAQALAPAFLRIGGSEADKVYYDLSDAPGPPPEGFESVLTADQWARTAAFANEAGFEIFFTLNAGPGPRNERGAWTSSQSAALIAHATERGDPVYAWELGNEINAFQVIHGLDFRVDGTQYAADVRRARQVLDDRAPGARLAGPSSAFWPEIGEFNPVFGDFMPLGGDALDIVTWHYYPMQSRRCALAVRRADALVATDPEVLAEVDRWASDVEALVTEFAPGRPVWLGETGHAQCGGEPGLSETFTAGFWWLDQLGRMAQRGQSVVIRQTLLGSNYGLIDDETLTPRPDYWTSVLWKRLMGTQVLRVTVAPEDARLRAYAHCAPPPTADRPGSTTSRITLLVINTSPRGAFVALPSGIAAVDAFRLTADSSRVSERAASTAVRLNGGRLTVTDEGTLPPLLGATERLDPSAPEIWLPSESYGFFVLDTACP